MSTAPSLFEAFLKCPTKCWLRATNETPSGNAYAEWVQSQNESFRATETERLLAETPSGESARSPSPENLKASKWRLALDVVAQTSETPRSSRRQEAQTSFPQLSILNAQPTDQSLVTSAVTGQPAFPQSAFLAESHLHAVECVPAEGRRNGINIHGRTGVVRRRRPRRLGEALGRLGAEEGAHGVVEAQLQDLAAEVNGVAGPVPFGRAPIVVFDEKIWMRDQLEVLGVPLAEGLTALAQRRRQWSHEANSIRGVYSLDESSRLSLQMSALSSGFSA